MKVPVRTYIRSLENPGPIGETTAGTVRSKLVVITKATSGNLSAQECTGTQLNNIGQSGNVLLELPNAAAGLHGSFIAGTTAAFYYRFDPQGTDKIYLDGAALTDGYYVGFASIAIGNCLTFWAFESATGVYDWYFASGSGNLQAQA